MNPYLRYIVVLFEFHTQPAIRGVPSLGEVMSLEADFLGAFEEHSPDGIRECLARGASAVDPIKGKRPIDILIEMYTRSQRFAACLRVMRDAGASVGDELLEAVLLDDDSALRRLLQAGADVGRKFHVLCAYTNCAGVTALHLCAEFNSLRCARVLIEAGAQIDARADIDGHGLGGQTPLFHAVNGNHNHGRAVMELLVDAGADLDVRLKGLVWGDTLEWETVLFDVTPLSYAQCGLYRQFHRRETDVYSNLEYLYRKRHGSPLPARNIPNRYLAS